MRKMGVFILLLLSFGYTHAQKISPELSKPKPTEKAVPIKFKNEVHNFGAVQEGRDACYVFEFKNVGRVPVILHSVVPSCCTSVFWMKDPILPGKQGTISMKFDTHGRGSQFAKDLVVKYSTYTGEYEVSEHIVLHFRGSVVPADTAGEGKTESAWKIKH
jgi:hypothetical protein